MEKNVTREIRMNFIISLLIGLFIYNGYRFIITQGSENPLVSTLFNMIIFMAILIFIYHENEIIKGQKNGQTYLEKYFGKKKERFNGENFCL